MINFLLILNTIVSEKENKLRHGMEMMGLIPSVYWTSWLLINTLIVGLSSLVTCCFGLAFGFPIFTNGSFGVSSFNFLFLLFTFFLFDFFFFRLFGI